MTEMLMTVEQVAKYLQVPTSTLYYWRHRGEGPPSVKAGRLIRYRRAEIDKWLEDQASDRASA